MALGDDYATLTRLKNRLGITDNTDDTELQNALSSASRGVEGFCRRQFNQATTASARTYYPLHARLVLVHDFHTTTDLAVKIDEDDDGTFETTLDSGDYQLEPLNGVVDGEEDWPFWRLRVVNGELLPKGHRATVEVTAQWGWSAVPASIPEATLIVAEETFKLKDAPFGVAGYGEFGAIRVRENPKVAQMLAKYRRDSVRVA